MPGACVATIERGEALLGLLTIAEAFDLAQVMDLEIHRPGAVGQHVVLVQPGLQMDAIGAAREQIDRRGAEQFEVLGVYCRSQAGQAALQQHHHLEAAAVQPPQWRAQPGELCEQKRSGQAKYSCSRR